MPDHLTSMRLDAHQHFWRYSPTEHTWMTDKMGALKHDFLPADLEPLLKSIHFDGCVAVQARQSLEETEWLLDLAQRHSFIKGVVGWVDLQSEKLSEQLQKFSGHPQAGRGTPRGARRARRPLYAAPAISPWHRTVAGVWSDLRFAAVPEASSGCRAAGRGIPAATVCTRSHRQAWDRRSSDFSLARRFAPASRRFPTFSASSRAW